MKFYLPGDDSTSSRHHDSEILCHLRHRNRVRSPPDSGDRAGRSSSLPNSDTQPAKKGEFVPSQCGKNAVASLVCFAFPPHFSHLSHLRCLNASSAVANHAHSASRWWHMHGHKMCLWKLLLICPHQTTFFHVLLRFASAAQREEPKAPLLHESA